MNNKTQHKELILLYDMDGTIVNNNNAIIRSWNNAQKEMQQKYEDFPKIYEEDVHPLMGQPGPDVVKNLNVPTKYRQETLDTFRRHIISTYSETTLYPMIEETLVRIKKQKIKTALVTGARKESAVELLDRFDLLDFFDAIIGGDSTKKGKPHPDPVLSAINQLKTVSHNLTTAYFIGDSINDIKAAKAAGIYSVFYSPENQDSNQELRFQADFFISNHLEIFDLIKIQ